MLRNIVLFIALANPFLYAQKITGLVLSLGDQEPLSAAHVFLNNLSKGTNSDEKGYFEIADLKEGRYELVVSHVGYETFVQRIDLKEDTHLKIELIPKTTMLKEVVVGDDKNWKVNYQIFLADFLGQTYHAKSCKILNPDVLNIVFEADSGVLKVSSEEMLIIENKALGYKIKYLLKEYRRNLRKPYMTYYGFVVFEKMKPKNQKQFDKWRKNRQEAYFGSLQHFLRGVYQGNYEKENFEVRRILTVPADRKSAPEKQLIEEKLPPDSIRYFDRGECFLNFSDQLQISYFPLKKTKKRKQKPIISEMMLVIPHSLIDINGTLQNPLTVMTQGYWAWKERMGDMLPYNFWELP